MARHETANVVVVEGPEAEATAVVGATAPRAKRVRRPAIREQPWAAEPTAYDLIEEMSSLVSLAASPSQATPTPAPAAEPLAPVTRETSITGAAVAPEGSILAAAIEPQTCIVEAAVPDGSFEGICADIRHRVDQLESTIVQQTFEISDRLVAAKKQYEVETGTGHGRRNPARAEAFVSATAKEIGRSPAYVQRLLTIANIDPRTRGLLVGSERPPSQNMLLAVAREVDVERRAEMIGATHDNAAVSPLVKRAKLDPALAGVLKALQDPKKLGCLDDAMPVPANLATKFPELKGYASLGDVRADMAAPQIEKDALGATAAYREKKLLGAQRTTIRAELGGRVEREKVSRGRVHIKILDVTIPRAVMEKALADTVDNGSEIVDGVLRGSKTDVAARHNHPPIGEAVVTVLIGLSI